MNSACLLILSAVPEEVKPKFVKGAKRYGRRSRPDGPISELTVNSEETPSFKTDQDKAPISGVQGTGLRRSTSLESVEVNLMCGVLAIVIVIASKSGS